jgi:hypothetical protein
MHLVSHGICFKNANEPDACLRDARNLCVLVQFVATAGVFVDGKDMLSVVDLKAVTDKIARLCICRNSEQSFQSEEQLAMLNAASELIESTLFEPPSWHVGVN